MKNKILTIIANCTICLLILMISFIGFRRVPIQATSQNYENVYYSAPNGEGVSLMFNVYQNTDCVYKILDQLDEYQAKATFFVGGSWVDDNIDCVKEIGRRGHEVASHGYFHRDQSAMDYKSNYDEIEISAKLINMILLSQIRLFAPPSGAYNSHTVVACNDLQLKMILWSRDTIDWRDQDPALIYERATKGLKKGEFILMHPTESTVIATKNILTYITEAGLTAITVSQNIGA